MRKGRACGDPPKALDTSGSQEWVRGATACTASTVGDAQIARLCFEITATATVTNLARAPEAKLLA